MKSHAAGRRGQILIGVVLIMVLMTIILPAMVRWIQQDSRAAVKDQKSTAAFNLAEAGIDRGLWKLKSSTTTWKAAAAATTISGYAFDSSYTDVPGGAYRILFSSGPTLNQVTITAEGRDSMKKEIRALQVVFENQSLPGPLLTSGSVNYAGAFEAHWGPIMAQNSITISGDASNEFFPRKYSKNVVSCPACPVANRRDTNGLAAPNTDNTEWWSNYSVPELPTLDFSTMRASAAANGTLNYYNVNASSNGHTYTGYPGGTHYCNNPGTSSAWSPNVHTYHFADSNDHPKSKQGLIWYWDSDLVLTGGDDLSGHSIGIKGTLIVRGNLTVGTEDNYAFTANVPANAWREYTRIRNSTYDNSNANQYPADNGMQKVRPTFGIGSETWTNGPAAGAYSDVSWSGFTYVGGNFTILANAKGDFHGVVWVNGNIVNNNASERSLMFYDATLDVPVLNVVLTRQSWKEIARTGAAWP